MITIMIAALNEEKHLKDTVMNVLTAAKEAGDVKLDVVIVNDGSTDKTPQVIKQLEKKYSVVRSIHHEKNVGIGAGVREVIQLAKYKKFMLMPGDNVVSHNLLWKLFKYYNKADFIVSYFINKEIRTIRRNILSDLYGLIYMNTFRTYVEYLNSVCLYPTEILRKFEIKSERYSIPAEMTIKTLKTGCTFCEIPGYYLAEAQANTQSVSLKNLWEVIVTYFRMVHEIFFVNKKLFNKKPVRVYYD